MSKELNIDDLTGKSDKIVNNNITYQDDKQLTDRIFDDLTNDKNIRKNSRLTIELVDKVLKTDIYATIFNNKILQKYHKNVLETLVSVKGLGRREYVQMIQQNQENILHPDLNKKKDIFR